MQLLNEQVFPLVQAVEQATGTRPHVSTIMRWSTKGARGIRLETLRLGARIMTSPEAVRRFIERTTERYEAATDEATMPTPKQAEREAQRAADELRERLAGRGRKKAK